MDESPVVTVFLRHDAQVLLLRRSEAAGSYAGQWGGVAGHAEGDPDAAARQEIREETGIDPDASTALVRHGEPFSVTDRDLDTRWIVHPYLFDCDTRTVEPSEETTEYAWTAPTAILRRETVPDLWTSYDRVRPRVETVARDREHGAAYVSVRALEVLRDEAALAATTHPEGRSWDALLDLARELVSARPSMPVVANRIDRAVDAAMAEGETPAALETAASEGHDRAVSADGDATAHAADRLEGTRIATLSRSGTATATLERCDPEGVLVAESRPGGEGVAVASDLVSRLGADTQVTLTTDAAFAQQLDSWQADAVLVGADALLPDGRIVNKVGTRGGALAATHESVPVVVVASLDKLAPAGDDPELEERPERELTDDDRVEVANPTFDVTPPVAVDVVVTERGSMDPTSLRDVADEYRELRHWRA